MASKKKARRKRASAKRRVSTKGTFGKPKRASQSVKGWTNTRSMFKAAKARTPNTWVVFSPRR
tara:strand:+ start:333 stop:521 length:189 start_codon:yes stop_codon:yes gene_type:complete